MNRGQSTLDYVFLLGVAAAGLIVMITYVGRGFQGSVRDKADQLGAWQYDPAGAVNDSENKYAHSNQNSGSSTTIDFGDNSALNAKLKEIKEKQKEIKEQKKKIKEINERWEKKCVDESLEGSKAVRDGNFDWTPPEGGLKAISIELQKAKEKLILLLQELQALIDSLPERAKSKTLGSSSYNNETGNTSDTKYTDERIGNIR